jgi:ketosteroid isomerase-like protein
MNSMAIATDSIKVIERFFETMSRHDVAGAMALMTADCIFENTLPAPDGERFVGQAAVKGFLQQFLKESPNAVFQTEETIALGDRCVVLWRYTWANGSDRGHVRGVDVCRVRDGKVAEMLSYVKG